LSITVAGGAESGEDPFRIGGETIAPKKIHHVDPAYPEAQRRLEQQQLVFLDVVIDEKGRVRKLRRLFGSDPFAKAAATAVREWRYSPFARNSKPVSVIFTVSVAFVFEGQPRAGLVADALADSNERVQLMAVDYVRSAPRSTIPDVAEVAAVLSSGTAGAGRAVQLAAGVAYAELMAREAPIPPPDAPVEALLQHLSSPDPVTRAAAAWQLAGATDSLATTRAALLGLTADEDRRVRYAVQWALGQLPPDQGASILLSDKAPPTPKRVSPPEYPEDAFRKKTRGTVLVDVLIGEEGEVAHTQVRLSVPSLDEAALTCVRQWQFDPAREAGKPVAFLAHVPVRFNIR
jgi:TonB family protein